MVENAEATHRTRFREITRREHLPDEIARVLEREITDGNLGRGDRLPTESTLAEEFGVSRNVVREAIARLKHDGLVESKQGLGAFVSANPSLAFRIDADTLLGASDLLHVFELRAEVEAGAAALAAERRTAAQLGGIRRSLDDMAQAITEGDDGVPADAAFHRAIAEAANNPLYRDFMIFLSVHVSRSITVARRHSALHDAWTPKVQREHERIFQAIVEQNPTAAREAVRQHLIGAAERLGMNKKLTECETV